jgi:aspartate ammonia-lyase
MRDGITATRRRWGAGVESFIGPVTAQPGHIGSTEAIDIAKEALAAGRSVA